MRPIKANNVIIWCILFFAACGGGSNHDDREREQTTTVSGTVLDAIGGAIQAAEVTFSSEPVVVSTDIDGQFSVALEAGEHEMVIRKNDMVLYSADVTCSLDEPLNMGDIQTGYRVLLDEFFDNVGAWELYEYTEGEYDTATAEIQDGLLYVEASQDCGYAEASARLNIEEPPGLKDYSLEMLVNNLGGTGEGSIWLSINFSGFHFGELLYDLFGDFSGGPYVIKINHIDGETCVFFDENDIDRCWTPNSEWDIEPDQATIEFSAVAGAPDCYESAEIEVDEIKIYATE